MFLVYDIETTGLITSFDQVTEFAALSCDKDFNILSQQAFNVRLTKDSIPAIEALQVTPQLPSLVDGICEAEALHKIHTILVQQPYNGGYNTLRFDDELLRFSFYRHGLLPYQHQNPRYSRRFDVYPIVALFYIIHPKTLQWPIRDDRVSLSLDALNTLNGFQSGKAHVAMFDVEVTHALMRHLAQTDRAVFNYALGYFNKDTDKLRFESHSLVQNGLTYAYLFDPRFGSKKHYMDIYIYRGIHPQYPTQTVWQSLLDPSKTIKKKWGEPPWIMPENIQKYIDMPINILLFKDVFEPVFEAFENKDTMHQEADLYTNAAWMQTLSKNKDPQQLLYRWRYHPNDITEHEKESLAHYQSYLLHGKPSIGYDHLGREKRNMLSIHQDALKQATPAIQELYTQIEENISS